MYNTINLNCDIKTYRDHASHRDGTSVDTRYPTSTYINPKYGLEALYNKVKVVENNETNTTDENTRKIVNWVNEARKNIDKIAKSNDVKLVYIGNEEWFQTMLIEGKNKNDKQILGLSTWSYPSNVTQLKHHMHHIHIEFKK